MKVTITTHGGLAAGMRREPRAHDTENMPRNVAAELCRLVEAAQSAPRPEAEGPAAPATR